MYECLMRAVISVGVMEMSVMLEIFETNEERSLLWKIIFLVLYFLNQKCLLEAERIKLHGIWMFFVLLFQNIAQFSMTKG